MAGVLLAHLAGLKLMLESTLGDVQVRSSQSMLVPMRFFSAAAVPIPHTPVKTQVGAQPVLVAHNQASTTLPDKVKPFAVPTDALSIGQKKSYLRNIEPIAETPIPAPSIPPNYLPSTSMERRPTPVSQPNVEILQGLATSGLPVRLRIYIDSSGKVVQVVTLEAQPLDDEFAIGLQTMFLETAFIPGRLHGQDQASFMDIEWIGR